MPCEGVPTQGGGHIEGEELSEQSAHAQRSRAHKESPSDAQLIANLRDGDVEAYEELWLRHIGPALRMARRLAPHHAEDLAAEAFTTVLHQITVAGGGPDQSFRAYLFTVMRNLAIRWNKESRLSLPLGEADDPVADDSHQRVADDEDAQIVLRAFRSLPHRWQQVLWLAEVDEEPRPAIATHLKMSPNSVSALLRRARHGLRYRCLTEHVPEPLRSDRSHVARVLPDLVTGKLAPDMVVKVTAHLAGCGTCREVHSDLRGLSRRVKHATLGTLGFGALTVLFKDLGTVGVAVAATAAAGSAAAGTAAGGLTVAGPVSTVLKVAAMAAGVIAVAVPVTETLWQPTLSPPMAVAAPPARSTSSQPSPSRPQPATPDRSAEPEPVVSPSEEVDPYVDTPVIDLQHPATPAPARPSPTPVAPGSIPGPLVDPPDPELPAESESPSSSESPSTEPSSSSDPSTAPESSPSATPTTAPSPSTSPAPSPTPTIAPTGLVRPPTTPSVSAVAAGTTGEGWFAPLLSGSAQPGATVAIHVTQAAEYGTGESGSTYALSSDATGAWSFDLSSLGLAPATYRAIVWQVVGASSSPATTVEFTIKALRVDGLLPITRMDHIAAEMDGIIITAVAAGQQTVCLNSSTGQEVIIPLGPDGTATRRIRFVGLGDFELEMAVCEGGRRGAPVRGTITVTPAVNDPWGIYPDPGIIVEEP